MLETPAMGMILSYVQTSLSVVSILMIGITYGSIRSRLVSLEKANINFVIKEVFDARCTAMDGDYKELRRRIEYLERRISNEH